MEPKTAGQFRPAQAHTHGWEGQAGLGQHILSCGQQQTVWSGGSVCGVIRLRTAVVRHCTNTDHKQHERVSQHLDLYRITERIM